MGASGEQASRRPASSHAGRFCNPPELQTMADMLEIEFASLSAAPVGTLVVLAGEELALAAPRAASTSAARAPSTKAAARRRLHRQGQDRHRDPGAGRHRRAAPHRCSARARRRTELDRLLLGGVRLRPDQRPQGRGSQHPRRSRRSRRGRRRRVRGRPGARRAAAQLHLQEIPHQEAARGRRRGRAGPRRPHAASSSSAPSPMRRPRRSQSRKAVAEGVFLARDLVNEPANVLGPVEFADRMRELTARRPRGRGAGRGPARASSRWARCWR